MILNYFNGFHTFDVYLKSIQAFPHWHSPAMNIDGFYCSVNFQGSFFCLVLWRSRRRHTLFSVEVHFNSTESREEHFILMFTVLRNQNANNKRIKNTSLLESKQVHELRTQLLLKTHCFYCIPSLIHSTKIALRVADTRANWTRVDSAIRELPPHADDKH